MNIQSLSFSHSKPSKENEDALLDHLRVKNSFCFAIADGIGGNPGGKLASKLAIKEVEYLLRNDIEIIY